MRRLIAAVALVLIIFGATTSATAAVPEPRVALVIGNSGYDFAPLKNPANDAHLIAETLRGLGFQVIEYIDVDQRGMRRLIRDFGEALDDAGPDSVGLFYYAGHGVQVRGENFLIPTGAIIQRESDVKIEAVSANEILNTLSFADNRLNFVILDACRDNPYSRSFRTSARGLARMDAPRGTLVAYATAPGELSADGDGDNSPYTLALSEEMKVPDIVAEQMFKQVRVAVMEETKGEQVPWEESSLTGDFYFMLNVEIGNTTTAAPAADTEATERLFWESIKDSGDPAMFDEYLQQFPDGTFAGLAKLKRDAAGLDIESETQTALLTSPPELTPVIDEMDATFVALQTANVRAAPTTQSDRLGQLSRDDAVVVTGKLKDENWYRVEYQGQTAYVYGTLIKQIDAGELAAWLSIENSTEQADFKAFLASYPSGNFAERARVRRDLFTPEPEPKPADLDLAFWESIKNSSKPYDYQAYLQRFPDGHFVVLARAGIKVAEDAKREEAERLETERKAAEDARRKAAEIARRKAAAEEAERQAAQEAIRKEAERKAAEEAAQEEAEQNAESERDRQEDVQTALLVPPEQSSIPAKAENVLADPNIKRAIIQYYKRKKIQRRPLNGRWWKVSIIQSIYNINILNVTGNIVEIDVRYRWEFSDSSPDYSGSDRGVVILEKTGSSYRVLKFKTGGMTYGPLAEGVETAALVPPPQTSTVLTADEILDDPNFKRVFTDYYNEINIKQRTGYSGSSAFYRTTMEAITDVRVLDISGNILKIEIEYQWRMSPNWSKRRSGIDHGIATLEKSGSSYKVLKFTTGGMTYGPLADGADVERQPTQAIETAWVAPPSPSIAVNKAEVEKGQSPEVGDQKILQ